MFITLSAMHQNNRHLSKLIPVTMGIDGLRVAPVWLKGVVCVLKRP